MYHLDLWGNFIFASWQLLHCMYVVEVETSLLFEDTGLCIGNAGHHHHKSDIEIAHNHHTWRFCLEHQNELNYDLHIDEYIVIVDKHHHKYTYLRIFSSPHRAMRFAQPCLYSRPSGPRIATRLAVNFRYSVAPFYRIPSRENGK